MHFNATTFIISVSFAILAVVAVVVWEEITYRRCKKRCLTLEREIRDIRRCLRKSQERCIELEIKCDNQLSELGTLQETVTRLKNKIEGEIECLHQKQSLSYPGQE